MKKLTIFLLLISQITFAQSTTVSETIKNIEFKEDSIKSVFDWLTDNIRYDVRKLKGLEKGIKSNKKSSFRTKEEYQQDLLNKVIKKKKGVCEDYALLFDAIVSELG